jgi:hypothetical protein
LLMRPVDFVSPRFNHRDLRVVRPTHSVVPRSRVRMKPVILVLIVLLHCFMMRDSSQLHAIVYHVSGYCDARCKRTRCLVVSALHHVFLALSASHTSGSVVILEQRSLLCRVSALICILLIFTPLNVLLPSLQPLLSLLRVAEVHRHRSSRGASVDNAVAAHLSVAARVRGATFAHDRL